MKTTLALYLLLLTLPFFAFSQTENLSEDAIIKLPVFAHSMEETSPISFEKLDYRHGLSSSVNSIFKDKKGFLWVSSSNGVYRYDGFEFKTFKKIANQSKGLANNWTLKIFGDTDGRMWLCSKGNILHLYDDVKEQFQQIDIIPDSTTDSSRVEVIYFLGDRKKRLWLATKKHGLNLLEEQTGQLTAIDLGEGKETVIRMIEDKDENLWLITNTHLMRLQM